LKIDSNPFAKGFRDSSRLSDLERESIEQMIKDNSSSSTSTISNTNHVTTPNPATFNQQPHQHQQQNSEFSNSVGLFGKC